MSKLVGPMCEVRGVMLQRESKRKATIQARNCHFRSGDCAFSPKLISKRDAINVDRGRAGGKSRTRSRGYPFVCLRGSRSGATRSAVRTWQSIIKATRKWQVEGKRGPSCKLYPDRRSRLRMLVSCSNRTTIKTRVDEG